MGSILCRFYIQCPKMLWPWNLGHMSLKVPFDRLCSVYGFLLVLYSNFVGKMHRFWDDRLVSIQWPWNPGYRSLKVIETNTNRFGTYFLLTFHSNHGPILYHFQDIRQFQSKIVKKNFPPLLFCVPTWNWVLALGSENENDEATGPTKKCDDIFSRLDRMHERDRQMDGWTPGHSKDHAYAYSVSQ